MARNLSIAAVQAAPRPIGADLAGFAEDAARVAADTGAQLLVYPELHLFGWEGLTDDEGRNALLNESAIAITDPFVAALGSLARSLGRWLIPGSICERGAGGELYNTALVFAPDGSLAASYRKVFPWRPSEPYDPGDRFVVFDIDGVGRLGLSICYDAWFPEVTRQLAWQGAEAVINIVKTTTPDREQEVVLAQANSIVNQTFTVSVNSAGPVGRGRSLIVDPEGAVRAVSPDAGATVLTDTIDLAAVERVRENGTAGYNRMWSQFRPGDAPIELPLYDGRIDPSTWQPRIPSPLTTPTD
ncbi:carbon-nitrogen hydrolase family protein [Leifsonia poae]|uniref:carbon-nitrogen hydrolase family protein n=1 Tax=Leifsonia poae TaxID=110933 RepID=UPI001CBDC0DC|nr:carbon-nitrogen hydrolase family protein [Leifsonia poae]